MAKFSNVLSELLHISLCALIHTAIGAAILAALFTFYL